MKNLQNHIFSTTTCISKETMLKFINKQLSKKELHQVQTHLIDCDFCSEALEGMAHAKNPSILFTIDHQIDKRTQQKSPSIARILMVAASVLLFVFGSYHTINNFNDASKHNENEISFQEPQKNTIENILPAQEELMKEQKEAEGEINTQTIKIETQKNKEVAETVTDEKRNVNYGYLEESPIEQQVAQNDYRVALAKDKTSTSATSTGSNYKAKVQDAEDSMMDMDNTITPNIITEKAKVDRKFDKQTTDQLANKSMVSDNIRKSGETKKRAKKELEAPAPSSADDFKNREGDEITLKEEETVTRNENTSDMPSRENNSFAETISTTETLGGVATGSTTSSKNVLTDGIEYYKQKKYSTAIPLLDSVLNSNETVNKKSEARWYKALCLIELKDITEAKKLLNHLVQYNNPFSGKAEEKLKGIE